MQSEAQKKAASDRMKAMHEEKRLRKQAEEAVMGEMAVASC